MDVAGTYGSTVLLFTSQLVGCKYSFYQGFYIAAGYSVQRAFEMVALLKVTVLVAAHCDNKES